MGRVPRVFWMWVLLLFACPLWAAGTLEFYFIDTDGGHATLVVAPSGASLLMDTGNEGYGGRDATRIRTAAKEAGVKKIDYLLITRFEKARIGGLANLLSVFPVGTFLDHGPSVETGHYPEAYEAAFAKAKHQVVAPGDKIPLKGLNVTVVASAGRVIDAAGAVNSHCDGVRTQSQDTGEFAQSIAILIEFGKFRFTNVGDLTANQEQSLLCPQNKLGKIELYLTPLRGAESKAMWDLSSQVAILNNGARTGGDEAGWKAVTTSPEFRDIWQIHFALANGGEANAPDALIANLTEAPDGNHLKVTASEDGSFSVYNPRNKYTKKYGAR